MATYPDQDSIYSPSMGYRLITSKPKPRPLRNPPIGPCTSDLFNPLPRGSGWFAHGWDGMYCSLKAGTCPLCLNLLSNEEVADLQCNDKERNKRGFRAFQRERIRLGNGFYTQGENTQ